MAASGDYLGSSHSVTPTAQATEQPANAPSERGPHWCSRSERSHRRGAAVRQPHAGSRAVFAVIGTGIGEPEYLCQSGAFDVDHERYLYGTVEVDHAFATVTGE